jgi:sugar (pentulose or hexulose) kinase
VFFYPYFDGSYYPAFNKNNKGTFLGLNLSHDRYHMARAIMEGVTFELRRMLEGLEKENFKINRICLTGGATKSSLWTEMISNIIGKEIFLLNTKDAPCMGAAIIAMYGAGFLDDMAKGASSIIFGKVIQPNTKITQEYESIYKRYCDKYEKLCNIYE